MPVIIAGVAVFSLVMSITTSTIVYNYISIQEEYEEWQKEHKEK